MSVYRTTGPLVFIAIGCVLSFLWQLKGFNWLIMGKRKIGFYCYLTVVFTEMFFFFFFFFFFQLLTTERLNVDLKLL